MEWGFKPSGSRSGNLSSPDPGGRRLAARLGLAFRTAHQIIICGRRVPPPKIVLLSASERQSGWFSGGDPTKFSAGSRRPASSGLASGWANLNFRIVARLDRRCLGAEAGVRSRKTRSETSSISRLGGSRWRLRRTRGMQLAMEFEWVFLRLLFGAKREYGHFQGCEEETQIPPHTWRIISRAASAAPAA